MKYKISLHLSNNNEIARGFQGDIVLGEERNQVGFMFTFLLCKGACDHYSQCNIKRVLSIISTGGGWLKNELERNIVNTLGQIILETAEDFINNNKIWSTRSGEIDWVLPIDIEFKNLIEEKEVKK